AVVVMSVRLLLAYRAAMCGFVVPLGVQPDFCQRRRVIFGAHRIEKAHPAQFREFAHMRVEHIAPRIARTEFDDATLSLRLHEGVYCAQRWLQRCASIVVVEEMGV